MKPSVRILLSGLLTAVFLYLFFRSFDPRAAWESLRAADARLLALAAAANVAGFAARAWRWRYLLEPVKPGIGMYNLTATTFIGYMVSFAVPLRLGEVVRPMLLARREQVSAAAAFGTAALERVLDAATLMGLFSLYFFTERGAAVLAAPATGATGPDLPLLLRRAAMATGALVVIVLPLIAVLVLFPDRLARGLHRLAGGAHGPLGRAAAILENFAAGLGVVRRAGALAKALALSLLTWLLIDLTAFLVVRAFAMPLRFSDTFLLLVPLTAGIAVPTPGGVGPYEYLGELALNGFWGIDPASAAAAAATLHAIVVLPAIALGLLFMWRDGLRPSEVRRLAAPAAGARAAGEGR